MDYRWIAVVAMIFIGLTLICNIMTGTGYITATDRNLLDAQKMTQEVDLGLFSIPIPGSGYVGAIIRMVDFSEYNNVIFSGMGQIIYFALAGIVFLVGFFLFITIIGLAVGNLRR
jgi:hypothetical protein